MVNKADINRMAENYAMGFFLSEQGEVTYDELMEALDKNELPDDVTVWQPFEDYSCDSLIYFIEALRDDYLNFADRLGGK